MRRQEILNYTENELLLMSWQLADFLKDSAGFSNRAAAPFRSTLMTEQVVHRDIEEAG
jgi:hypothetical protein